MRDVHSISYAYLLAKSWPIILANAAVPLLGLVDTAVIGNVGDVTDLGAIAFGALIFSFVYWSFGFLRMGTTGFVAQAAGAEDEQEVRAVLGRALILAVLLGLGIILLQWPIRAAAFALLDGSAQVESVARDYFNIRIWGAPATLANFVVMGVFIGLGKSRLLLITQLFLNGSNMLLDIVFAGVLGWGAPGIAAGTVCAEWGSLLFAFALLRRELIARNGVTSPFWPRALIADRVALRRMLTANGDIMIRTLLMVFSFAFFINQSARYGDVQLAANHILLQLISFSAFFLDGYAFVAESLVGQAMGARRIDEFDLAVRRSSILAFVTAVLLAALIWFFGAQAVAMLTDLDSVRLAAGAMLYLAAVYVLVSFVAFQLDGIFIGVSYTRQMRNAAFWSLLVFLIVWWVLAEPFAIEGLWWAMIVYVIARALALLRYYPMLRRALLRSSDGNA